MLGIKICIHGRLTDQLEVTSIRNARLMSKGALNMVWVFQNKQSQWLISRRTLRGKYGKNQLTNATLYKYQNYFLHAVLSWIPNKNLNTENVAETMEFYFPFLIYFLNYSKHLTYVISHDSQSTYCVFPSLAMSVTFLFASFTCSSADLSNLFFTSLFEVCRFYYTRNKNFY